MSRQCAKTKEMSAADVGFLNEARGSSLDKVARMRAKLVLEVAMGEEAGESLGRNHHDGADTLFVVSLLVTRHLRR